MSSEFKVGFWEGVWLGLSVFFENWVYPAYHFRNFLFGRYDLVKLPLRRSEYSDVVERMYLANMELIRFFIEEERPEERVQWYGDFGHKYGEITWCPVLYREYEGRYVMDIIKEIYRWYVAECPLEEMELNYAGDFWMKYLHGKNVFTPVDDEYEMWDVDRSDVPKSLDFFDGKGVDWRIIDKICPDRGRLLDENYFFNKMNEFENAIFLKKQKYLHLAIEVREYLWT